ncbi:hypothetical protein APA_3159 [Pseudanabaena sp. lw0831]|uniref:hypothetical protein n=1 Tax=Pseudanabaena sp. lw0831 TaxID=1357935 RepID=UPI001914E973|nr:hypothetical protein [Pseudanabaena sp. lw0831]GBO55109.1 hypothetical protein APA_3159 [Pseudanabaena sp. lw0831]
MKFSIFLISIFITLGFILCTVIAIIINPHIFTSFFSNSPTKLFYDIEHYSNLAIYQTCNAFYPLWPWLINKLAKPQIVDDAALYFRVFGGLLSLISIPLFLFLLVQNIKSYKIISLVTAIYAMNPLSVFRMIGYTEGIFSFLSLIFLIILNNFKVTSKTPIKHVKSIYLLTPIFILSLMLSLTRPFLIQAAFASIFALVSILVINRFQNSTDSLKILKIYGIATLIICLGATVGYCIYGYYCLESRGDFFAPFHDQENWRKQLGFYPHLFFVPITYADFISIYLPFIALITSWLISISTNIRKLIFVIPNLWQWILLFAYPPAFLAFYGLDFKTSNFTSKTNNLRGINLTQSAKKLSTSYVFWFCIYFALIHTAIIVFSDQKLTSLRRFIFGTPYFFFAIAYISQCFPSRKVSKLLLWILGISSIWLVQYWLDYANGVWIG